MAERPDQKGPMKSSKRRKEHQKRAKKHILWMVESVCHACNGTGIELAWIFKGKRPKDPRSGAIADPEYRRRRKK